MIQDKTLQLQIQGKRDHVLKNELKNIKTIYWGEVRSIDDPEESGRIKVNVPELDKLVSDNNLVWAKPLMPRFIHVFPKKGEAVRIIVENTDFEQATRYWEGPSIPQLQDIYNKSASDEKMLGTNLPISQHPKAKGIFPNMDHVGLIGRDNTEVMLKDKEVQIRAGKHIIDDVTSLNRKNPASINLVFEETEDKNNPTRSSQVFLADKIAFISHEPSAGSSLKYKATDLTQEDRDKIFADAFSLARGELLVKYLEIMRKAIVQHIHPYDKLPTDISGIIPDLAKINFDRILQTNLKIN